MPRTPGAGGDSRQAPQSATAQDVVIARTPPAPDDRTGQPAIACSLQAGAARERLEDWQAVLGRATSRHPVRGGMALTFPGDPDLVTDLARLAVAEQACCPFFAFTLALTSSGVRFEVRAPDAAHDVVLALFGPPGPTA